MPSSGAAQVSRAASRRFRFAVDGDALDKFAAHFRARKLNAPSSRVSRHSCRSATVAAATPTRRAASDNWTRWRRARARTCSAPAHSSAFVSFRNSSGADCKSNLSRRQSAVGSRQRRSLQPATCRDRRGLNSARDYIGFENCLSLGLPACLSVGLHASSDSDSDSDSNSDCDFNSDSVWQVRRSNGTESRPGANKLSSDRCASRLAALYEIARAGAISHSAIEQQRRLTDCSSSSSSASRLAGIRLELELELELVWRQAQGSQPARGRALASARRALSSLAGTS